MNEAKIAGIYGHTLILNKGSSDGIENRMMFTVYGSEEILDPDSKDPLDIVRIEKDIIEVIEVNEKTSLAKPEQALYQYWAFRHSGVNAKDEFKNKRQIEIGDLAVQITKKESCDNHRDYGAYL